jgi:uncharacterized DUF497 family protein
VARYGVEFLAWDDDNEEHVYQHVDPDWVDDMFEEGDWVVAPNKKHQPRQRRRMIGRTPGGQMLTVVIEPTDVRGVWKPITAYLSEPNEVRFYQRQTGR